MTKKTLDKNYAQYRAKYKEMRKAGNLRAHQRPLTKAEFEKIAKATGKASTARKDILFSQSKTRNLTYKQLDKALKTVREHGSQELYGFPHGNIELEAVQFEDFKKTRFRNVETMIKGLNSRQLFSLLIASGMTKQEVMDYYGY